MNRLLLVIAFVIAVLGPVSAGTFYRFGAPSATSVSVAGLIAGDGTIINGKGFSVQHLNTGHYLIEIRARGFPLGMCSHGNRRLRARRRKQRALHVSNRLPSHGMACGHQKSKDTRTYGRQFRNSSQSRNRDAKS